MAQPWQTRLPFRSSSQSKEQPYRSARAARSMMIYLWSERDRASAKGGARRRSGADPGPIWARAGSGLWTGIASIMSSEGARRRRCSVPADALETILDDHKSASVLAVIGPLRGLLASLFSSLLVPIWHPKTLRHRQEQTSIQRHLTHEVTTPQLLHWSPTPVPAISGVAQRHSTTQLRWRRLGQTLFLPSLAPPVTTSPLRHFQVYELPL